MWWKWVIKSPSSKGSEALFHHQDVLEDRWRAWPARLQLWCLCPVQTTAEVPSLQLPVLQVFTMCQFSLNLQSQKPCICSSKESHLFLNHVHWIFKMSCIYYFFAIRIYNQCIHLCIFMESYGKRNACMLCAMFKSGKTYLSSHSLFIFAANA